MKKTKIMFKLCVVSLAATMLLSGGIAEIGGFVWEGIGSVAVSAAGAETPASSFEYVENDDGAITITRFIGNEAEVVIPEKIDGKRVTKISRWYNDNNVIRSITIPKSVTEINDCAFLYFESLQSILVDEENESYSSKDGVLFNKDETELICYPRTKVGVYTVPDSVKTIKSYAFYASKLTKINIGENVSNIGEWEYGNFVVSVFDGCTELQEINVSPNNEYYNSQNGILFNEEKTVLLVCPIQKQGIYEIPSTVTEIGGRAFENCYNLTDVILPEDLEEIGYSAFSNCKQLTSINIPKKAELNWDEADVFESCERLIYINVDIDNQLYSSYDGLLLSKDKTELLCCPAGKTDCLLPDTVTEIGYGILYGKLQTITLPQGFVEFTPSDFWGAENLTEILIDEENPYYTSVDGVVFDKDVIKLLYCPKGKTGTYIMPDTVEEITLDAGSNSPFGGNCLEKIVFSDKVEEIPGYAFAYSNKLKEVELSDNIKMISWCAFANCDSLTSITIPDSVEEIKRSAFDGCQNLISITVLNSDVALSESYIGRFSDRYAGYTKEWTDPRVTLYGYRGSTAENYAAQYDNISFVAIDSVKGDTNGDGVADIADSLMISRYDAGLITLDDAKVAISDVNSDGTADIADALKIARFDAGLLDSLS